MIVLAGSRSVCRVLLCLCSLPPFVPPCVCGPTLSAFVPCTRLWHGAGLPRLPRRVRQKRRCNPPLDNMYAPSCCFACMTVAVAARCLCALDGCLCDASPQCEGCQPGSKLNFGHQAPCHTHCTGRGLQAVGERGVYLHWQGRLMRPNWRGRGTSLAHRGVTVSGSWAVCSGCR